MRGDPRPDEPRRRAGTEREHAPPEGTPTEDPDAPGTSLVDPDAPVAEPNEPG